MLLQCTYIELILIITVTVFKPVLMKHLVLNEHQEALRGRMDLNIVKQLAKPY